MTKAGRIGLSIIIAVLLAAVLFAGMLLIWARPDRLSEDECRNLIRLAWDTTHKGSVQGARILEYRIADRHHRIEFDVAGSRPILQNFFSNMFPQVEPGDEFFANLTMRNMGRVRIARHVCERVRLTPSGYKGDSEELWIDPATGYLLAWRKLDYNGRLIRGFRFRNVTGFATIGESDSIPEGMMPPTELLLSGPGSIPPEIVLDLAGRHQLVLPDTLPPGFKLIGARRTLSFEPPMELERIFSGAGAGLMTMPGGPMGRRGEMQVAFSDGLNTITIILVPPIRLMELVLDPQRVKDVLDAKSAEVERIFHTSMSYKLLTNGIVLLYGDVAPDVLDQVAGSIPDTTLDIPEDEMVPPIGPGNRFGPGPGHGRGGQGFGAPEGSPPFGPGRGSGEGSHPDGQ